MVRVGGHRGAPLKYAENTLQSFDQAFRAGADFVEFDVRPSRDGYPVVIHDRTLDRTTTGSGQVSEHSVTALQDVTVVDDNAYPGDRVQADGGEHEVTTLMTLDDVLTRLEERHPDREYIVELKEGGDGYDNRDAYLRNVFEAVASVDDVIIQSFDRDLLDGIQSYETGETDFDLVYLTPSPDERSTIPADALAYAADTGIDGIAIPHTDDIAYNITKVRDYNERHGTSFYTVLWSGADEDRIREGAELEPAYHGVDSVERALDVYATVTDDASDHQMKRRQAP